MRRGLAQGTRKGHLYGPNGVASHSQGSRTTRAPLARRRELESLRRLAVTARSGYQVRLRDDDNQTVDGTFSDAAAAPGGEETPRDDESRREGLREKLVRSLETHRNRIAAEVDERSAELTARAAELDEEQARLAAA